MLNDSELVNLPYLRCDFNETLRLHLSSPLMIPQLSSEKCTVGGYYEPRGTMFLGNSWAKHKDYKVWEKPSKFKCEKYFDCS